MKFKVLVTRVEGFFIPDIKNPEINVFKAYVPRMTAKEEKNYLSNYLGTDSYTVTGRLKARFPLEFDVIKAIENSIEEIADFFTENEEELVLKQVEEGVVNDTDGET